MKLSASEFYNLHQQYYCELRVTLLSMDVDKAPPGPMTELLTRLGEIHEARYLSELRTGGEVIEITGERIEDRIQNTMNAVTQNARVIYRPFFQSDITISGENITLVGEPDFLIKSGDNYIIRDCKIARRITEKDHPEIFKQLSVYGYLYSKTFGHDPIKLEIYDGCREIHELEQISTADIFENIEQIVNLKSQNEDAYSPIGWSKCMDCGFKERCFRIAVDQNDLAILPEIPVNLVVALRSRETKTIGDLIRNYDENTLAEVMIPHGTGERRFGKKAIKALKFAHSFTDNAVEILDTDSMPIGDNFVMFDIENLPEQLESEAKVYLWGLKIFGENPSEYMCGVADFDVNGDLEGWQNFLSLAKEIINDHGDIKFVHWSQHEKTFINKYVERYGDIDGVAESVLERLVDLFLITKKSIIIPVPSYSLKAIEQYVGFSRTQDEFGGQWSIAKYTEAMESEDAETRKEILDELLKYNEEDLDATWHVMTWLSQQLT